MQGSVRDPRKLARIRPRGPCGPEHPGLQGERREGHFPSNDLAPACSARSARLERPPEVVDQVRTGAGLPTGASASSADQTTL